MAQNWTYLEVPKVGQPSSELCSVEEDEDEEPYEVHLILRSSPIPRKKSFLEKRDDEETCSKPPLTGCKVHFADRLGLDLVEVKFFEKFELSDYLGPSEVDLPKPEDFEFHIVPEFALPADLAQLLEKVRAQMVELESVETVEGDPLSIQGLVRVLNLDFVKTVHIRASLDSWATYYDYPAEYVSDQADTHTNLFRFRLSFVPPFVRDGARFEFAARYEVPEGVHWANNAGRNYSVRLQASGRETQDAHVPACEQRQLKSCLKPARERSVNEREEFHHLNTENWDSEDPSEAGDSRTQVTTL
ncbi:protein phosphatase 1 regulatory subunit 3A isoform X2 [Callorhinchus milii]|uniref:protein phosphatase 1 regulatory subunit 3A isoform X2 n=1 Tax=Callorhinchus milii TaxID=7868 RepID=UPI001C3F81DE|nr:protein phosphatase 1 regulatory subunit 3A isoform X2 [Callorhinchus milii]